MGRRGRPPHPDILTPREWEVLALLRDGLSNPEIAERLGITRDGVKYHVSEILGKLGLASREEAAAWRPEERPWWQVALGQLGAVLHRTNVSWLAPATTGVVVALVIAGITLMVWGLVRTGGNGDGMPGNAGVVARATDQTTATGEPTSAQPELPFEILGPLDRQTALSTENLGMVAYFILDLPTGEFYVIRSAVPDINVGRPRSVHWLDDETLLLEMWRAPSDVLTPTDVVSGYRVRLDGSAIVTPATPATPPDWPAGVLSPDSAWTAMLVEARFDGTADEAFGTLLVGRPNEDPSYRLTTTSTSGWTWWQPAWSPTGNLLAFTGNVCRGFDLSVFDPEHGELRNLTASLENQVFRFSWRPDGFSLVASVYRTEQQSSTLQLIDLATGSTQTLLEGVGFGLPQPLEWNPSGDRLLFNFFYGGWCEEVGLDVPTPPPTRLEILSQ